MNTNSRFEDITINLSSSSDVNLTGIVVTADPTTCKIRTAVVNVTSSGATNKDIYGVLVTGTTSSPFTPSSSNLIRATTINATSSSSGGKTRGLIVTSASNVCCRDTNVYAKGTNAVQDVVGVDCANTSAYVQLKSCSVSGTASTGAIHYDILQPVLTNSDPTCLELANTDLINDNANGNGFTSNVNPSQTYFCVTGNLGTNFVYILPGTQTYNNASTNPIGLAFVQTAIIFQGSLQIFHNINITNGTIVTLELLRATDPTVAGTLLKTFTLTGTGATKFITTTQKNWCETFSTTDFIQVRLKASVNLQLTNTVFAFDLY
jgi:hypothetical protein